MSGRSPSRRSTATAPSPTRFSTTSAIPATRRIWPTAGWRCCCPWRAFGRSASRGPGRGENMSCWASRVPTSTRTTSTTTGIPPTSPAGRCAMPPSRRRGCVKTALRTTRASARSDVSTRRPRRSGGSKSPTACTSARTANWASSSSRTAIWTRSRRGPKTLTLRIAPSTSAGRGTASCARA